MRRVVVLSSLLLLLPVFSFQTALAQTLVSIELLRGEKGSARRGITNQCRAPHTFELTENPEIEWFSVAGEVRKLIAPGGTGDFFFEFDSAGMDNGTYGGEVSVRCLDCAAERGCGPERFPYTLRLRVQRPVPDPELQGLGAEEFVAGQVLAALNVRSREAAETAARGLELTHRLQRLSIFELRSISRFVVHFAILDPADSVASVVRRLEGEPLVDFAQHVYRYFGFTSAQRDYVGRQHALKQIRADLAQRYSDGSGVKIAVVDTGIDDTHRDLRGRVKRKKDFTDGGLDTHGTIMAGIIAAVADNGFGINGVAPGARIISIKVLKQTSPTVSPEGSSVTVLSGTEFAIQSGAGVINMSYGLPRRDPTVTRQVKAAVGRGMVAVAAAGNGGPQGRPNYPAALSEVIAVSAVDVNQAFYSNGTPGAYIDVAAPGVNILSTMPGDAFQYRDGTSQAAAHVTGVVALLLSKRPRTPPKIIKAVLEQTPTDLGAGGKDIFFGSGLVDACKALETLIGRGGSCR